MCNCRRLSTPNRPTEKGAAFMASVYKKARDKGQKGKCWYFDYTDHEGQRRTEKGFTDKALTVQLAAKREEEVRMRQTGMVDPAQEKMAVHRRAPLAGHLDDFERHLRSGTNTSKHVQKTMTRIRSLIGDVQSITEIDAESVQERLTALRTGSEDREGIGHRTHNHYV